MESLARLAARRPVAVSVIAAAFVILGWTAWQDLPLDLLPDMESPTLVVSVRAGDRPPAEMERLYGELIEQRLFAVNGIREIKQVARTGRIIATVIFDWDADMNYALVEVEKATGPIRSDPDVEEVLVRRFDPRQAPVISLGLVSDPDGPSLAGLRRIADRQVSIALERLKGVAEARVTGGRIEEIRVSVDRYRMESYGVSLGELESRLRAANVDLNAGTLEDGNRVFLVRGLSRYRTPADVGNVVLHFGSDASGRQVPIRVRDVADVAITDKDITHLVRVDGQEGVGLSIYKEAGSNTVAVSRTVREAMLAINRDLPGVTVSVVSDDAALVEDSIRDVQGAALVGVGLAILVLMLFLRTPGPTVVVALAVPVSLLATLFFMRFSGQSLNVMTLGGLALGAGMLVDNAIVVVESIFRRLAAGDSREEAAAKGTGQVIGAIIASTLTTCAVFVPIIFVQGLAARLVSGLAFTVVVSLVVSLFVAAFLIPALARWLLPTTSPRAVAVGAPRLERFVSGLLRRPLRVVLFALLAAVAGAAGLYSLGSELLPPSDPRQFSVRLVGPPGQRVESTARTVEVVEELLRRAAGDDLVAILSEIGRLPEDDRLIREEQTEENTARILVRLRPGGASGGDVVARAAPAVLQLGNLEANWEVGVSALARSLGSSGPPVVVEISGRSLEDLRTAAESLQAELAASTALWNVRSSFEGGPPELRVELDRTLADGLGVGLDLVSAALEASLDGRTVTVVSTGDEEREVVLRMPAVRREELLQVPLTTESGMNLVVGDVARLRPTSGAREIFRRDQRRVARVTARITDDANYPLAMQAARDAIAAAEIPAGLIVRLAGEEEERTRTFAELRLAGILALLLVFMVLAGTFESLIHPLTVAISIPLSLIGVALILVPMGRPLGVMEILGLIVLAGVAVNDAILLVDTTRGLMRGGIECAPALAKAAAIRLRPILMTTFTTVLAMLPLAWSGGEGAQLRQPLALTIIGGIIFSTIGSLTVIPCVFLILERLRSGTLRS